MLTITAVIRARKGQEGALRDALLEVADNVRANEPDTVGFFISQDLEDPASSPPTSASPTSPPWIGTTAPPRSPGSSASPSRCSTAP